MSAAHEIEPTNGFMFAALHFATKGWRVFPVKAGSKGHPLIKAWQKAASNDPEQVRRWWSTWPDANIAIVCDEHFGFGLDFDDTTIRDFLPAMPETLEARTPRGGQHVFFLHPPGARVANSSKGLRAFAASRGYKPAQAEGTIDVRGVSGYVIAPPSVRADRGGAIYRWHNEGTAIAPAPGWLVEALSYRPPGAAPTPERSPAATGDRSAWLTAALEGEALSLARVVKGGRGTALNRAAFKLGQRRASLDDTRRYLRAACETNGYLEDDTEEHFEHELVRGWGAGQAQPEIGPVDKAGQAQAGVKKLRAIGGFAEHGAGANLASRPTLRLGPELHETVDAAVKALVRDPDLYQRDGHLVRVVRIEEPEALRRGRSTHAADTLPAGTPKIVEVPLSTLTERLTRVARFERFDKRSDKWVGTIPPKDFVAAVAARSEWPGVRPLIAVTETPIVRPDFSVRVEPGYDGATGVIYLPGCELPTLPTAPTLADAQEALSLLSEPFADFPYRSPADRAVPVAAVLSLLARPAIAGAVPGFLLDASTRGSGKSLQADVIAQIATGRDAPRMSWPRDEVELEKVLGAYALRGASLIMLDNLTSAFGGGPVDRVLTAQDTVEIRVLSKSEVPTLRWRAVIIATGNNIEVIGDTTRRVLVSRLEPEQDSPEDRIDFRHPDLLAWVREERPRLVVAALTILRAWALAGRPIERCRTWGSFEAWARVVPAALVWAGSADPMRARINSETEDPERALLSGLLEALEAFAPEGITIRALVERLYPPAYLLGARSPDNFTPLRDALETLAAPTGADKAPSCKGIGKALSARKGRWVGGRRLVAAPGRGGVLTWRVEHPEGGFGGFVGLNHYPPRGEWQGDISLGVSGNEPTKAPKPTGLPDPVVHSRAWEGP